MLVLKPTDVLTFRAEPQRVRQLTEAVWNAAEGRLVRRPIPDQVRGATVTIDATKLEGVLRRALEGRTGRVVYGGGAIVIEVG